MKLPEQPRRSDFWVKLKYFQDMLSDHYIDFHSVDENNPDSTSGSSMAYPPPPPPHYYLHKKPRPKASPSWNIPNSGSSSISRSHLCSAGKETQDSPEKKKFIVAEVLLQWSAVSSVKILYTVDQLNASSHPYTVGHLVA